MLDPILNLLLFYTKLRMLRIEFKPTFLPAQLVSKVPFPYAALQVIFFQFHSCLEWIFNKFYLISAMVAIVSLFTGRLQCSSSLERKSSHLWFCRKKTFLEEKMLLASCIRLTNCFPLSNLVVFLFVYVYSERRKSLTGPITVCMLANLVQNVKTCMLGNQLK